MKNLKRIFSLALAGTMLAGMLTIGASAANFTDAEDIKNDDAVNFMVALNIINGNDDGSFAPERTVSRAEMAKMITIALNGGKEPVLGTKATPTFSDIKGNWAEKYIEYCANLGIIGGRGNGTFDPTGTVTGTEAAKMVLVAMGYDSTVFNFTGADWAINVNTEANNATPNKLYKGIESIDPNAGLSRDNAAQLIFNGVQDHIMVKSPSLTITNGEISYSYTKADSIYAGGEKTILTEKYGYKVEYGFVTDVTYVEDDDNYDVTIEDADSFGAELGDKKKRFEDDSVAFAGDVSALYGQQVKVVHDGDGTAVGIYPVDSTVLASVAAGDLISLKDVSKSIKIDGTTYRFDGSNKEAQDVPVYTYMDSTFATTKNLDDDDAFGANEYLVDLIDNDGNGRINCALVHVVKMGQVTYLGKETVSFNGASTIGSGLDLEDDVNVYEGIKKDDYVVAVDGTYTVDGKIAVTKAEVVKGTVGATRATDDTTGAAASDKTKLRIDGTWYDKATNAMTGFTTPKLNADVQLMVVNGYYFWAEAEKTQSKDLVVLTAVGTKGDWSDYYAAKLAFMDGTTATANVKIDDDVPAGEKPALSKDGDAGVGKLYTYEMDGSNYVLTPAKIDNTGYDKALTGAAFDADKDYMLDTPKTRIADDAVVVVLYRDGTHDSNYTADTSTGIGTLKKVSIITGKALKSWDKDISGTYGNAATTVGFADTVNGVDYAQVLVLSFQAKDLPGASGDVKYGFIVSKSYQEQDGSKVWTYFDLWNGEETVSVKISGKKVFSKGTAVSYKDLGGDEVGSVTAIGATAAVTGYNEGDEIITLKDASTSNTYDIDKDTSVIYINTKDGAGVESNGIELAAKLEDGKYEQNVYYVLNTAKKHVEALFVDVNNKIKDTPNV